MKILMVCAELAPLAKTGGLADAVAGLSAALARAGHDVRVLLPRYASIAAASSPVTNRGPSAYRYLEAKLDASPFSVYLLDAPELFAGDGVYAGDDRDALRFAALADAAAALPEAVGWMADVVHCHDWHAALFPVLRRAHAPQGRLRCVLTLHNIGYQGVFALPAIADARLASVAARVRASATPTTVNYLRIGVETADLLTTVSPTYAREIQTAAYGMGLEDLLSRRRDDLVGILNGVDYSVWDPRSDPHITPRYAPGDRPRKREVKQALCDELRLSCAQDEPVLGLVARLVTQKGIDLLADVAAGLIAGTDARFALLGNGDPAIERALAQLAARAPERVAFTCGYDEALAHRILAGSDIVLVPSRYEPCGLTQMYALRYGSIPVVRATGGLADTIRHFEPGTGMGNGSVFEHADTGGLQWAIEQALAWYADDNAWATLVGNAFAADFSWERQVGAYEAAYARLL